MKKQIHPFLVSIRLLLTLKMFAEKEPAQDQKLSNNKTIWPLQKINFPGTKERCEASIETEGTMRQPRQM